MIARNNERPRDAHWEFSHNITNGRMHECLNEKASTNNCEFTQFLTWNVLIDIYGEPSCRTGALMGETPMLAPLRVNDDTVRLPNDVRIDCKAAKHSDGDRGALCAPH